MLHPEPTANPTDQNYQAVTAEIVRGIHLVSGLSAKAAKPGWIAVECGDAIQARWLSEQIVAENVESYAEGTSFFVPVGKAFTLKGEIKNIVTVVAKTSHYWSEHINPSLRQAYLWEIRFKTIALQLRRWFMPTAAYTNEHREVSLQK